MGKTRTHLRHPIVRRYGAVTKAMTRTRLVAVSITAGLILTGCGGPAKAGAAAIIGDTTIPVEAVQQRFDAWLKANPAAAKQQREGNQMATLGRRQASIAITRELIRQVAAKEGVTYAEDQKEQAIELAGGREQVVAKSLDTMDNIDQAVRAQLLAVGIGRKFADHLAVVLDFTNAATYTEAQAKAKEMARSDEAAAALVRKDTAGQPPNPQTGQSAEAARLNKRFTFQTILEQQNPAVLLPLFTAKPGDAVALSLNSGEQTGNGQWLVARVKSRTDRPVAGAPSQGGLAEQLNLTGLEAVGQIVVSHYANELGVQVNPRYGEWAATETAVDKRVRDPRIPGSSFSVRRGDSQQ